MIGVNLVLDLLPSTLVWGWVAKPPTNVCQKDLDYPNYNMRAFDIALSR